MENKNLIGYKLFRTLEDGSIEKIRVLNVLLLRRDTIHLMMTILSINVCKVRTKMKLDKPNVNLVKKVLIQVTDNPSVLLAIVVCTNKTRVKQLVTIVL